MSNPESPLANKAARAAASDEHETAQEGNVKYQTLDETDGDDLMGAIGIDLEETADIISDDPQSDPPPYGAPELDLDAVAAALTRAVLAKLNATMGPLLARLVSEAVNTETQKLKEQFKR